MLSSDLTCNREKQQSRSRSIKCLDYAMAGTTGAAMCEAFVDALGLKTLFSAFMGKVWSLCTSVIDIRTHLTPTHPVIKEAEVRTSSPCV